MASTASTASSAAPVCGPDSCEVQYGKPVAAANASSATASEAKSGVRTVKIDIVSDTICPWCFVGKRRLEKAIKQLDPSKVRTEVEWHPFQLDPTLPTPGKDKLTHYRTKFGPRMDAMIPHMQATGAEEGIKFDYGGKVGNTVDSHRLVEFAKRHGKQDEMVTALMHDYFEQKGDVSDVSHLVDLAASVGLDRAATAKFLASDELRDQVMHESISAAERGISGVPYFTFDGRYHVSGAQSPEVFLSLFKKLGVV